MTYAERFRHFYDLAQPRHRIDGANWYGDARMFCLGVALDTGTSITKVAGVMAALSPATYWERNKNETKAFVHAHVNNTEPDINISCYLNQVRKADAIMDLPNTCVTEEVAHILGAHAYKTRAFLYNILYPVSGLHITIDRHMVVAADMTRRTGLHSAQYHRLESAIMDVANAVQRPGPEVQATIWLVVKDNGRMTLEPCTPTRNLHFRG